MAATPGSRSSPWPPRAATDRPPGWWRWPSGRRGGGPGPCRPSWARRRHPGSYAGVWSSATASPSDRPGAAPARAGPASPGGGSVALVDGVLAGRRGRRRGGPAGPVARRRPGGAGADPPAWARTACWCWSPSLGPSGPAGRPAAPVRACDVALMPDGWEQAAVGSGCRGRHPGGGLGPSAAAAGRRGPRRPRRGLPRGARARPGRPSTSWSSGAAGTGHRWPWSPPAPRWPWPKGGPGHHVPVGGATGLAGGGGGGPHRRRSPHRALLRAAGPAAARGPRPARGPGGVRPQPEGSGPPAGLRPLRGPGPVHHGAAEPWPRTSRVTGSGADGAGSTDPRCAPSVTPPG